MQPYIQPGFSCTFRLVALQSGPGPARVLGAFRDRLIWVLDIANALGELHEPELNQALIITTHLGAEQPYGGHKMDSFRPHR